MIKIIRAVQSFDEHAFDFIAGLKHSVFGGKRVNTCYPGVLFDDIYQRIIFDKGSFLRNQCLKGLFFLDADMSPETKYFLAHFFLEAIGKRQRDDHDGYADHSSYDGKANNEPGKRSLLIKSYAVCYKACNLQIDGFVLLIEFTW